ADGTVSGSERSAGTGGICLRRAGGWPAAPTISASSTATAAVIPGADVGSVDDALPDDRYILKTHAPDQSVVPMRMAAVLVVSAFRVGLGGVVSAAVDPVWRAKNPRALVKVQGDVALESDGIAEIHAR